MLIPVRSRRTRWGRGSQTNNYPSEYAISPDGQFSLGPIPDDIYRVSGEYRQAAVVLAVDADIPGLPTAFEQIIVWQAIMLLAEFDEAIIREFLQSFDSLRMPPQPMTATPSREIVDVLEAWA